MLSEGGSSKGRSSAVEASLYPAGERRSHVTSGYSTTSSVRCRDASTPKDRPSDDPSTLSMTDGKFRYSLRQPLQQHPHVESVAEPPQSEGGGGATVEDSRVAEGKVR